MWTRRLLYVVFVIPISCGDAEPCHYRVVGDAIPASAGCVRSAVTAGCLDMKIELCSQITTYALDEQRNCWRFNDSCVPAGYSITSPGSACDSRTFDEKPLCNAR